MSKTLAAVHSVAADAVVVVVADDAVVAVDVVRVQKTVEHSSSVQGGSCAA